MFAFVCKKNYIMNAGRNYIVIKREVKIKYIKRGQPGFWISDGFLVSVICETFLNFSYTRCFRLCFPPLHQLKFCYLKSTKLYLKLSQCFDWLFRYVYMCVYTYIYTHMYMYIYVRMYINPSIYLTFLPSFQITELCVVKQTALNQFNQDYIKTSAATEPV